MFLDIDLYKEVVKSVPIVCVDMLLTSDTYKGYLLVKRMQEPMKDHNWPPGGRKFINEHFVDCALRIAQSELGLGKEDLEISNEMAGLYTDIFTQSSFGIHTYETFSIVVRGKIKTESLTRISTDETSESFSFETNLPNRFASKTTWYKK
jgi:ADP-ribose pyrophosphatase YjhB (NUDIX family)